MRTRWQVCRYWLWAGRAGELASFHDPVEVLLGSELTVGQQRCLARSLFVQKPPAGEVPDRMTDERHRVEQVLTRTALIGGGFTKINP